METWQVLARVVNYEIYDLMPNEKSLVSSRACNSRLFIVKLPDSVGMNFCVYGIIFLIIISTTIRFLITPLLSTEHCGPKLGFGGGWGVGWWWGGGREEGGRRRRGVGGGRGK